VNETTYKILVNNIGFTYAIKRYPGKEYVRGEDGVLTIELGEDDMEIVSAIADGVYDLMLSAGFINE